MTNDDGPATQRLAPVYLYAPDESGERVARAIFSKRGNHSEAHLSEPELAAIVAAAIEIDRKQNRIV